MSTQNICFHGDPHLSRVMTFSVAMSPDTWILKCGSLKFMSHSTSFIKIKMHIRSTCFDLGKAY